MKKIQQWEENCAIRKKNVAFYSFSDGKFLFSDFIALQYFLIKREENCQIFFGTSNGKQ